jgi:hypothetical protein
MKTEQLKKVFENAGFSVRIDKKDKSAELEKWTDGGVDMVIYLKPFTVESFEDYVNDFDVDEEIEVHRQDSGYKSAFTLKKSLEDFTDFHNDLKELLKGLKRNEWKIRKKEMREAVPPSQPKRIFLAVTERGRHKRKISFYIAGIMPGKGLRLIDNDFTCSIHSVKTTRFEVLSQLVTRNELTLPLEDENFNLIMVEGQGLNYVDQIQSDRL